MEITSSKITDKPSEIIKLVKKARNKSFFVHGKTECIIEGKDSYLPLAGNVRVTQRAMLDYLKDIERSTTGQEEHRGVSIVIELSIHGDCYFV